MSQLSQTILRCLIDKDEVFNPFTIYTDGESSGSTPRIWQEAGCEFQLAWKQGGALVTDISNLVSVKLQVYESERMGARFIEKPGELDTTLTSVTWADGTKQHARFVLTAAETNLPASRNGTEYYLELIGYLSGAVTVPVMLGWTRLHVFLRGEDATYPVQAGNLIPSGVEYDVSGDYAVTVLAATWYNWTAGDSDISVTNGTETITTSGANFVTQGTTLTLHGTPEAIVTAVVRKSPTLTADDIAALVTSLIGGAVGLLHGAQAITPGDELVTVDISAHGLGSSPARVIPCIIKPSGGDKLGCELVDGTVTAMQFQVELSSPAPASGFKVAYILIQ